MKKNRKVVFGLYFTIILVLFSACTHQNQVPYIQHAGETNPENFVARRLAMIRLSQVAGKQTSAWLLTGGEKFAEAVCHHLEAWFVNPDTRMNPSLNFAQAIKDRVTGRGIGIIDAIHLIELWKTLDGYPETPEVIRNLPIRNPLFWVMDKPFKK
jgi:hypothetical protein